LRDSFWSIGGAWNPIGAGVVYNTAVHLTGHEVDNLAIDAHRRHQQGAERALSRRWPARGRFRDGADH
jgi:hypothetical protein